MHFKVWIFWIWKIWKVIFKIKILKSRMIRYHRCPKWVWNQTQQPILNLAKKQKEEKLFFAHIFTKDEDEKGPINAYWEDKRAYNSCNKAATTTNYLSFDANNFQQLKYTQETRAYVAWSEGSCDSGDEGGKFSTLGESIEI